MSEEWLALNRANWEDRTAVHLAPGGYDLSSVRAGMGRLDAIVAAELGDVAGLRVLHLQSHLGDDSLAIAQRGAAEVVGIDFSPKAVAAANALAAEVGATQARFVLTDVYGTPAALPGRAGGFDLVFTSWGTIGWLPDLDRWAQVIAWALRPGGAFYFADLHPFAAAFDGQADPADPEARPGFFLPYVAGTPQAFDETQDYANLDVPIASSRTIEFMHTLSEILGALRGAGLRLDWLHEHPRLTWRMFPGLVQGADRLWGWPRKPWLPLALSLRAVREG
jgi:SAM-dependent methyltransferase